MTTVVEIIQQELNQTEPVDVIVELLPYYYSDRTKKKVKKVYEELRKTARLRYDENNRIKSLLYAYYLGELLETKPKTPAQRTVLVNLLTKYYEMVSTRTYKLFVTNGQEEAIYRTKFLTLTNIKSLRSTDLATLY
jgi:hypothetical protein